MMEKKVMIILLFSLVSHVFYLSICSFNFIVNRSGLRSLLILSFGVLQNLNGRSTMVNTGMYCKFFFRCWYQLIISVLTVYFHCLRGS